MSAQAVLEARFSSKQAEPALDRFDKKLGKVSKSSGAVENALGRLTKGFGGLVAAAAGSAAVSAAIDVYIDFEQKIADLSAITGATGDDLKFLSDAAREFGATSKFAAGEAAEAFKLVASAKPDLLENGEALKRVTGEVLTLAAAAGIDLTSSAKTVGSALNQFGESADSAARFVNVLAAGSKFGASEVSDTAEALKFAGAVAKSAGLSFEETNAAIQLLAGSGIKASSAGTGLRAVLARLEKQSDQGIKPSVVGLEKALQELEKRNLSTADTFRMFGQVAAPAALSLIANADAFEKLEGKITGTNTAAEQAATQMDTLNGDLLTMKSALQELALSFVETFGDDLRTLVQGSTDLIKGFVVVAKALGLIWQGVKLAIQTVILAVTEALGTIAQGVAWVLEKVGLISEESKNSFTEFKNLFSDSIRIEMGKTADKMDDILGINTKSTEEYEKQEQAVKDVSKEIKTMADDAARAAKEQARIEGVKGDLISSMEKEIRILKALSGDYGQTAASMEVLGKAAGENVQVNDEFADKIKLVADELERWREFSRQEASLKGFTKSLDDQIKTLTVQIEHFGKSEQALQLYAEAIQNTIVYDEAQIEILRKKIEEIERLNQVSAEQQAEDAILEEIANLRQLRDGLGLTEREQDKYNATLKFGADVSAEFLQMLHDEIDLYHDKIEAMDVDAVQDYWNTELRLMRETETAIGSNERAREKLRVSIDLAGKATEEEIAQIHASIDAYYDQQEALEAVRETYDFMASAGKTFLKDFLEDGTVDFDNFLEGMKKRWVSAIADMATEKLILSIATSVDSQGGASSGQFAGGLFGGQGIPGQGGGGQAGGGAAGAAAAGGGGSGGAAAGLALSFFGGALGGYSGDQRGTTESQMSGILNGALTGGQYGGWVGAIVGAFAGAITSGFFDGTDWADVGARLAIQISGGMLDGVDRIRLQERDKPFLGGTDHNQIVESLREHEYSAIAEAFGLIRDSIVEGAEVLGLDTADEVLAAFSRSFEVDVTDLSEEEAQAAVQEMLNNVFSELARDLLPYNDIFFRLGETWAETFERVVASVRASQEGLERIGVDVRGLISDQYVNETAELMVAQLNEAYFGEIADILGDRGRAIPRGELDIDDAALANTIAGERRIRELLALIDETSVTFEEAVEIAVNRYQVALADAAGGPERLSELFQSFANTFMTTSEQMENALSFAITSVTTDLDKLLGDLGTTRGTFLEDFNAAQLEGIDPEVFVQYLQAAELLGQLFELEVQLAAARGEAVSVSSLTAEQVRLLTEDSADLVRGFETLGQELGVSGDSLNQFTLDLAAAVGSIDGAQQGLGLIFSEFFTRGQQLESIMEQAGQDIESLGYSVEEFATGGREHFLELFNAAVALGDADLIARLIELAPAVDAYLDSLDEMEDGVNESATAIANAAQTIKGLFEDIGLVNPEDFGGLFGFGQGDFFNELIGHFDDSGQAVELFNLILREFFTESERAALSMQNARDEISNLGFDVDQLVALGTDGFLEMMRAAAAAGDSDLVARLAMAAPFFLELVNASEDAGDSISDLGDDITGTGQAADDTARRFENLRSSISAAMSNVQNAIQSVLSTSRGLNNLGIGASTNLTDRISTLQGRLGQGSIESQIRNVDELTGLIVTRYEAEAGRIENLMAAEQQRIDSINAAMQARYQAEYQASQEQLRVYNQMQGIARNLREFLKDLAGGPLGGATPFEAMQVAQQRFEEALKAARGGDQDALSGLQGFAQTYLEAAQAVFNTSPEYFAIFESVTGSIRDLISSIEDQDPPVPPVPPQLITIAENSAVMAGYQQEMTELQAEAVAELEALQKELERLQAEAEAAEKAWREGLLGSNVDSSETLTKMSADNDELLFLESAANLSLFEIKGYLGNSLDEITASRVLLHDTKIAVREMSGSLMLETSVQTQILATLPETMSRAVSTSMNRGASRIVTAINELRSAFDAAREEQQTAGDEEEGDVVIDLNEPTRVNRRNRRSSTYGVNT